MKHIYIMLILIAASAFFVQAYSQTEDFSYGVKALNDKQYNKAKSVFYSLSQTDVTDCKSLFYLAKTYYVLKQYDSAIFQLKKIPVINPKSPFAFLGNGIIALHDNNIPVSNEQFAQARKISKKDAVILLCIADAYMDCKKPELNLAETFLREALELYPENSEAFMVKAKYDLLKGDLGKAANDYEWAYFYDDQNYFAYSGIGLIYSYGLRYNEAMNAFNKSIEIEPSQVMVYKYTGDLHYKFGKYNDAKKYYQKYLSVAEVTTSDIEKYAIILFYNKEFNAASEEMSKIMANEQNNPVMNRIAGYVAYETYDYENGLRYMSKLFEVHDTSKILPTDYLYYGKLLLKTGNESLGIKMIRLALEKDEAKTDAYIELANALSKNKNHDDAIAVYEKLLVKGIDKAGTLFRIGKEYYYKGTYYREKYDSITDGLAYQQVFIDSVRNDSTIAVDCYEKADSFFTLLNKVSPEYSNGYLWKGRVLSLIDSNMELGLARESYEKVLSLIEAENSPQNKNTIIECYRYLGAFYYFQYDRSAKTDKSIALSDKMKSIEYYQKIIQLDPADLKSQEIIDQMSNEK